MTTVETLDPFMTRVIGQRQELSFYDVKLANKAYCDGKKKKEINMTWKMIAECGP